MFNKQIHMQVIQQLMPCSLFANNTIQKNQMICSNTTYICTHFYCPNIPLTHIHAHTMNPYNMHLPYHTKKVHISNDMTHIEKYTTAHAMIPCDR